ncbi:MAG: FAD-dependent thymidylate synthase [Elusimicrobia bacterium]|nr:FAD-dependent thymidylate synthase [Elusimicrobiota bacterium]
MRTDRLTGIPSISGLPPVEEFTPAEEAALRPYVTNLDGPVFALVNLPEVVKGALFARYSRSSKSLRRLILDEFMDDLPSTACPQQAGHRHAEALYDKVFAHYGDDSVAQLGGVHMACEGVSNILTKVLERGRLMSYLEQSTRYVPYSDKVDGHWKYHTPAELNEDIRRRYREVLDNAFATYERWLNPMQAYYQKRHPRPKETSLSSYRRAIRAKALDALRGLLPAATRSNLGIFGTGQAYEMLLLRMRASTASETRSFADMMLRELRKVIPSFMTRVDQSDRGLVWSDYLTKCKKDTETLACELLHGEAAEASPEVTLTDFDPDGELRVLAAALYSSSSLSDAQLLSCAKQMSAAKRACALAAYVGNRKNRRHRPGRAFERTRYRFDVLSDYGAFRDLQRHRMLTIEWQPLSPSHGFIVTDAINEAGAIDDWRRVMHESADLYNALLSQGYREAAPYVVSMAYRIRFYMDMNAREAMHVIELRTSPQGHPSYRRVCQQMHRLIAEQAGHRAIAAAMVFANHEPVDLERLEAEKAAEARATLSGLSRDDCRRTQGL